MKDRHTKIRGYRDLTQEEIDMMNEIKAHGEITKSLIQKLEMMREDQVAQTCVDHLTLDQINESRRCLALAKTNLQQGNMWFVRAVALPDSF